VLFIGTHFGRDRRGIASTPCFVSSFPVEKGQAAKRAGVAMPWDGEEGKEGIPRLP